jgi:hypothetical protein
MLTPIVKETSALSAHRREVELVRWSLMAVPEPGARRTAPDPRDPLRGVQTAATPRRTESV